MYQDIDVTVNKVEGVLLSSPYGSGASLGQPLGVKSIGLIRIYTNIGVYGLGETYAAVYMPELLKPIVKQLESYLLGRKVGDDSIVKDLANIPFIGRDGLLRSVSSAVETALWDIRGKILDKPAWLLLGNDPVRDSVPVYASSGTAAYSPDEISKDVDEILTLGFKSYKMRVGYQDWQQDLKRVRSAREALGSSDLMVDAIMGTIRPTWDLHVAIQYARELIDYDLRWLEEPLHPDDISGLAELRRNCSVPIAAGEAYSGNSDYQYILDQNAVDVLQFDATHSGGIRQCVELAEKGVGAGMSTAVHVWGSAVAMAANACVALASENVTILEYPMVPLEVSEHMWICKPKIVDGIWLGSGSDAPGIGIELTESIIEKYPFVKGSGYKLPIKVGG